MAPILGRAVCRLASATSFAALVGCNLVAGLNQFDDAVARETVVDDASPADDSAPPQTSMTDVQDSGPAIEPPPNNGSNAVPDEAGATAPTSDDGSAASPDASMSPPDTVPDYEDAGQPGQPGQPSSGEDAPFVEPAMGTDASTADALPAGSWCMTNKSSTTLDCHDFDEGQPPQAGFTNNYFSARFATVTTADFAPGSPPGSLLISTPLLDSGGSAQDEQFNDPVAFHPKIELTFAVKIQGYDPGAGDVSLFRISYQSDSWAMQFNFQQNGANFAETIALSDGGVKRATYPTTQPSDLDKWIQVDCLIDFGAHTMSLSYDGTAVLNNQAIENPTENNPQIFVQTGLNYLVAPAKPMMIYTDNILIGAPE
jgi:hypothetical protein